MKHFIPLRSNSLTRLIGTTLALALSIVMLGSVQSHALNDNSGGSGNIAIGIIDFYNNGGVCLKPDGTTRNFASWSYASLGPSPYSNSITVPAGTDAVSFRENFVAAVCQNNVNGFGTVINQTWAGTAYQVENIISSAGTVTVNGGNPGIVFADYGAPNYNRYYVPVPGTIPMTISGLSGVLVAGTTTTINVSMNINEINIPKPPNTQFACVQPENGNGRPTGQFQFWRCNTRPQDTFSINIYTQPSNYLPVITGAPTCQQITGTVSESDAGQPHDVHLYFGGPASGPAGPPGISTVTDGSGNWSWQRSQYPAPYNTAENQNIPVYAYTWDKNTGQRVDSYLGDFNCPALYQLTPSATCDLDNNRILWSVSKSGNGVLASTVLLTRYRIDGGAWQNGGQPGSIAGFPWSGTTNIPVLAAGQTVDVEISVNPGTGPVTPTTVTFNNNNQPCGTKANKPYFQVWRSDIWTGGRFGKFDGQKTVPDAANGNTCAPYNDPGKTGAVRGFGVLKTTAIDEVFGSFVEYGIFANGQVDSSGVGNRNVFTKPISTQDSQQRLSGTGLLKSKELTFGNWSDVANSNVSGTFSENRCLHDYYNEYKPQATVTIPVGVNTFDVMGAVNTDGIYYSDHDITLTNSRDLNTGPGTNDAWYRDRRIILIVDGTVTVEKDIFFTGSGGVLSPDNDTTNPIPNLNAAIADLPFLMVVAKGDSTGGGNIFFDNEVDRADGMWVAQPHIDSVTNKAAPNTGIIDTCTEGSQQVYNSASPNTFFNTCGGSVPADQYVCYFEYEARCPSIPGYLQRRITIKGAIIAEKVLLNRLPGDVTTVPRVYDAPSFANIPGPQRDTRNKSNAAERIKVSPELYFSRPPTNSGGLSKTYDTYEILPPLL